LKKKINKKKRKNRKVEKIKKEEESLWITIIIHSEMCVEAPPNKKFGEVGLPSSTQDAFMAAQNLTSQSVVF
jgi:hypothetical protein